MSKMKHLLRKLHIGDQSARPPPASLDPSPQTPSQPSSSTSPSDAPPPTTSYSENGCSNNNFNFLEEEFQMQLALAISVSDPGQTEVDSEAAQINAVKQISLGRSPSQSQAEFLSLRYWSYNVVNYDEKVIDGFYDVCGIDSNLLVQTKMPSLADLETISILNNVAYEVVSVNRAVDMELRKLEERVYFISMECRALNGGLNTSFLVQKIADLIVERMGGPVSDVEEMFSRWRARNNELKIRFNSVVIPLGSLDVGNSRQRALLFKVLADRINLPCKLVKGSYYTGTDEGAVNLITLDSESEYIIDLMGAPGTLIPAETPGAHLQNFGLDARTIATIAGVGISSTEPDHGARFRLPSSLGTDETVIIGTLSSELSSIITEPNKKCGRIAEKTDTDQLGRNTGDVCLLSGGNCEFSQCAGKKTAGRQLDIDVSGYSTKPEYIDASAHVLPEISSQDLRDRELLERNRIMRRERVVDQWIPDISLTKNEQSHVEGLGGHQFKPASAEYQFNIQGEHNALVEHKKDDVILNYDAAVGGDLIDFPRDVEATEIAYSDQFNAKSAHDMPIDSVLNGVAEILWEDLQIGERIGIGSYGEVYRSEWNGTEVAVKKFMKQDISGDALMQFKCEIEIMLRLRHPNIVLLMGAVMRPPNMSILTEFLPRGSLYKLLHRPKIHIDEKRRIKMALDVAKGMNYLHTSHPIIVHRDLKTPNLLVDKNWVVKVCDFGMSRLQHHTFLSSKSAAGTAEWMAPEVLRNEPSNEKSDVYSFGVILWELATLQVPWTEMNSMQVVGAVGFQGRHLDIPPTVEPLVADIINDCWNRNPQARPSFAQIITRLKSLQRLSIAESLSQRAS